MGQELSQGSAKLFFSPVWHGLRLISGMQLADGPIWKVQDGITHMSGTLAAMAGRLASAGTVNRNAYICLF